MSFRCTQVRNYKGKPAIYIDGKPFSPYFYALTDQIPGSKTWETIPHKSISDFAKIGVKLFQVDVSMENIYFENAGLDITYALKQIRGILDVCPDCNIMFRFHVNPPRWWIKNHKSELVAFAGEETIPQRYLGVHESFLSDDLKNTERVSFASKIWIDEFKNVTREFVSQIQKCPEGNSLIAMQIANGIYGENHYWGGMHHMPDVGETMRKYFVSWLKNKYVTTENLRKAYHDDSIDFEDIHPAGTERNLLDVGIFRDPEKRKAITDYFICQHELTANNIIEFAKVIKEASDNKLLTGAFYGYYFSLFGKAASGGHLAEEIILNSEYIDFMCAPQAYGKINREIGGPALSRGIIESVTRHGKLWLDERDQPTHYGTHDPGMIAYPKPESIYNNRSHVLQSFIRGGGMWYYDFGRYLCAGWWDDPECMTENRELKEITDKMFECEYDLPSDALLVFDTKVFLHTSCMPEKDPFTDTLTNIFVVNAYKSGACVECTYLSDIRNIDLSKYKAVVFVNCYRLDNDDFDYIENVVKKTCPNVIFFTYPGYTDGESLTKEKSSEICSMKLDQESFVPVPKIKWFGKFDLGEEYDLSNLYLHKKSYSFTSCPMFYVSDENVEVLGKYEDGKISCAKKKEGNSNIYYFSVPPLFPEQINVLLEECGCHIYRKPGDATLCGGGIILISSKEGEEGTLKLRNGKMVEYKLKKSESAVFDASSGEKFVFEFDKK